jgi:hypothetical protein
VAARRPVCGSAPGRWPDREPGGKRAAVHHCEAGRDVGGCRRQGAGKM